MSKWSEFTFILKPSPLGGIGVFATHALPAGMQIFRGDFRPRTAKIKDIPAEFAKYCIFINEEDVLCPERFDRMEIGWFLNHSDQPNISKITDNAVITLRDIHAGEEILIDYNQFNEPENIKEPYYKENKL